MSSDIPTTDAPPAPTILWGARTIASTICKTERATLHMLERGVLPARKVGGQWVADRDALLAYLRGGPTATAA